jgi:Zn-dependent protease with chaperone function
VIELAGAWSDGKTSRQAPARLLIYRTGEYRLEWDDEILKGTVAEVDISPRIGNTPRRLAFPGGGILETTDNDSVDRLDKLHRDNKLHAALHYLESHWTAVISLTGATVMFVWLFMAYGVPTIARTLAFAIPASLLETSDEQTLALLDELYLKETALSDAKRSTLTEHLLAVTPRLDIPVRIEFRSGGQLGANAFALPGGTVVFTDELVRLANNREQLEAVYGHELGHLDRRHSLRRVAQNSLVTMAAIMITGDASATTDLIGTIPFILTDLAWSREFEREADDYALAYLRQRELAPQHFADIMKRLECSQRSTAGEDLDAGKFDACLVSDIWSGDEDNEWSFYLFSHPPSAGRIQRFQQQ